MIAGNAYSAYGDAHGRSQRRMSDVQFREMLQDIRERVPVSRMFAGRLKLNRAGREWKACCPFHFDKTPSLTINDDKGFYHCFGCGAHGDLFDAARELQGVGLFAAIEMLSGDVLPAGRTDPPEPERDTVAEARTIWRAAASAEGTPVQTYLWSRGLRLPIPPTIRFSRLRYGSRGDPIPVLVALVTGPDGKFTGIQRTYLRDDGTGKADVPKAKLSLGRVKGGAIRLAPVAAELAVAEGIEDALSVQQELGLATWAAAGASMLPGMEMPLEVQSVTIAADGDEAGEREARKAAAAFSAQGRSVRIMRPQPGCKDFNEQLQSGIGA